MDKLIKTISESGSFRAYVLDSTETVRTAQENTIHYHHQQLLWAYSYCQSILAANQKGESKLQLRLSETALLVISSL